MNHAQAVETHAVERYLLNEMSELDRHAFEAHYFECETCADDVRAGALMREGVKAGFVGGVSGGTEVPPYVSGGRTDVSTSAPGGGTEVPPNSTVVTPFLPRRRWSPSVVLPWAAAATLALAVGYQGLWTIPALRRQVVGPHALSPVPLRPASRGADVSVARLSDGPLVLALELSGIAPGTRLTYDLRTAGGQVAASGAALAPPPGVPLLLLIPRSSLVGAGSHVLSIRAAEGGPAALDYRFTISDQ
jgi:hypothetical protein